jgi:acetyltransferase
LAKQPRPEGNRLTIITNAGGPGVLATDALISGGGSLAEISPESMDALNAFLPAHWSHNNPVDILGDASPERYTKTLEVMAEDPESDGLLVILTPQAMTDPTQTAEELRRYGKGLGKPILASWMGGADISAGEAILNQSAIPTFEYPDTAVRMFNYMWKYAYRLRGLYETPEFPAEEVEAHDPSFAGEIVKGARSAGRTILTEFESKRVLEAYHIPTVDTRLAKTVEEAVSAAEVIGYPVVIKLNSETVTHKTDVGGVHLNLHNPDDVRNAFHSIAATVAEKASPADFQGVTVQPMLDLSDGYELIVGSSPDPQFGPVLLFGTGGTMVEVFKDRELGLPPLNTTLARRMMERTKIYKALKGVRGRDPVDLDELEKLMVRFSFLVVEQTYIKEIDINPLLASSERLVALDARVVLHEPGTEKEKLPKLAIRPYPTQYAKPWSLKDGTPINIRPIRPEDEPLMAKFYEGLSEHSVYMRYFHTLQLNQRVAHDRLTRICFIDYDREMVLIAVHRQPERKIIGIARLSKIYGAEEAEFSVLIGDKYQGHGLGSELVMRLLKVAKDEPEIKRVVAFMLPENQGMKQVVVRLGFDLQHLDQMVKASIGVGT